MFVCLQAIATINSLLEKADKIYKQLQLHRPALETLLIHVTEHSSDKPLVRSPLKIYIQPVFNFKFYFIILKTYDKPILRSQLISYHYKLLLSSRVFCANHSLCKKDFPYPKGHLNTNFDVLPSVPISLCAEKFAFPFFCCILSAIYILNVSFQEWDIML